MTQPSFVPSADAGVSRPSVPLPTSSIGRTKKAGLLGLPSVHGRTGRGTPGPDAGFALTLAHHALDTLQLDDSESHHDVEVGVALLAAKRAALVGRGPTVSDIEVVADLFGFRDALADDVLAERRGRFGGVGHSYAAQRAFVDAVSEAALRQVPGNVSSVLGVRTSTSN